MVFPSPVFLNLWPETQLESCLGLRWFILLTCCVDSLAFRLVLGTISFSALKRCALLCEGGVRVTQVPKQRGKNAVVAWPSKGWRCCHSHQVSWNTVSKLGFRQNVKFHVWPIHLDADPCALKVLSGSLLFFPSAGASCSRLWRCEVGSSRDWLCSVQTPSGRRTPRKIRCYQVWLPQSKLLCLLPPSSCC